MEKHPIYWYEARFRNESGGLQAYMLKTEMPEAPTKEQALEIIFGAGRPHPKLELETGVVPPIMEVHNYEESGDFSEQGHIIRVVETWGVYYVTPWDAILESGTVFTLQNQAGKSNTYAFYGLHFGVDPDKGGDGDVIELYSFMTGKVVRVTYEWLLGHQVEIDRTVTLQKKLNLNDILVMLMNNCKTNIMDFLVDFNMNDSSSLPSMSKKLGAYQKVMESCSCLLEYINEES